jgi:hypothetical protein
MRRAAVLPVLSILAGGAVTRAAVPPCFRVVTPEPDATNVPVDVRIVFHVTETDVRPDATLVEAGSGKTVPLDLVSSRHFGPPATRTPPPPGWTGPSHTSGNYTFRPLEELKPRTRYEIRCWKAYDCGKGNCPVSFTTGRAPAKPRGPSR